MELMRCTDELGGRCVQSHDDVSGWYVYLARRGPYTHPGMQNTLPSHQSVSVIVIVTQLLSDGQVDEPALKANSTLPCSTPTFIPRARFASLF